MLNHLMESASLLMRLGLWSLTTALYVVLAIQNRKHIAKRWKPGLLLSLALFMMLLPSIIFSAVYLELSSLETEVLVGLMIGAFIAITIHVVKFVWNIALFGVAEAEWNKTGWGASLTREQKTQPSWRELVRPFMIGAFAALISTVVFSRLNVKEGPLIEVINNFFPGVLDAPLWMRVPVYSLFVTSAAIGEELAFRGGILAFLIRITRRSRVLMWAAILLLNLPWALAHIPNTDNPPVKVLQMMILGIVFTVLARNRSLRSAMAAHVGLNLASVAFSFICGV